MKKTQTYLTPLMVLTIMAISMTGCRTHRINHDDWQQYNYAVPVAPPFVQNLLDSAEWYPDTICVVDGKAFYFAYDIYNRTNVIYNNDELLLENPTLQCESISSNEKYKFMINMADKQMMVDFKDKESLKEMSELNTIPASFCQFRKDTFTGTGNNIMYSLNVDFMKLNEPHAEAVNTWLSKLAEEYITYNNIDGTKYLTYLQNPLTSEEDKEALARRAAYRFFNKLRYELDVDMNENSGYYYRDVCLRAWHVSENFVTVLKYTNEYWNGAHGSFTEELVSYDPEKRREIDWDYLFKPGCREEVLNVFLHTVKTSEKITIADMTTSNEQIAKYFIPYNDDGKPIGKIQLPRPGLGENGVVFSFQPYHLGGFADGVFHITIPYQSLSPYLTEEAKRLLKMDD